MKCPANSAHKVQVNLDEQLFWVKLGCHHGLPPYDVILYYLFHNRALKLLLAVIRINFDTRGFPDSLLISDANITYAFALEDQLAAEEIFLLQILETVQDNILEVGDTHSQNQFLNHVQARVGLTPVEDVQLRVFTIELRAHCYHV